MRFDWRLFTAAVLLGVAIGLGIANLLEAI